MKVSILEWGRPDLRSARSVSSLDDLPDMKDVYLVGRYALRDDVLFSVRYVLHYPLETYSIDTFSKEDYLELTTYLDEKFKAAGIRPKMITGLWKPLKGDD